jgi:hypothetical protein
VEPLADQHPNQQVAPLADQHPNQQVEPLADQHPNQQVAPLVDQNPNQQVAPPANEQGNQDQGNQDKAEPLANPQLVEPIAIKNEASLKQPLSLNKVLQGNGVAQQPAANDVQPPGDNDTDMDENKAKNSDVDNIAGRGGGDLEQPDAVAAAAAAAQPLQPGPDAPEAAVNEPLRNAGL